MAGFRLETPRLCLREWTEADRPRFHAIMNTPAMTRHLGSPREATGVDALFARRLADQRDTGLCYWAVELRGGELIGSCGLRVARNYPGTPVDGMTEAGWRVGEAWQGNGFTVEAMHAALDWFWQNHADHRIGAWTTPENLPSLAVMARLGMRRAAQLDFIRPASGEQCLVHLLGRPAR